MYNYVDMLCCIMTICLFLFSVRSNMHFRATLFMSNYAFWSVVLFLQINKLASEDRQYVLDLQNSITDTSSFSDTSVVRLGRRERRQSASNGDTTDETSTTPPTTSDPGTDEVPVVSDNHQYYTSRVYKPPYLDQEAWPEIINGEKYTSGYRTSVSRQLPFKFPFYGHMVNSIHIGAGGFLYTSSFLHKYLTATQYIAPLMGDFDPEYDESSGIYYKSFENMYSVEWRNVYLHNQGIGPFHFQLYLFENGTTAFVYRKISGLISDIDTSYHPVKVGLSDAFYLDTNTSSGTVRRTIYEYHRVSINQSLIEEGSVVILSPLPTCNLASDCETCITLNSTFECQWCDTVQRCSDGVDQHRQEWLNNNCVESAVSESCTQLQTISPTPTENTTASTTGNVTTAADNTTTTVSTTILNETQSHTVLPSTVEYTTATVSDNATATADTVQTTVEVTTVSSADNVTTSVEIFTASVTDGTTVTVTAENVTTSVEVSTGSIDNVTTTVKLSTTSVADNTTTAGEISTASVGDNATAVADNVTYVVDNITTTTEISTASVVDNVTAVADNVTSVADNITTTIEVSTASVVDNVTILADNTTTTSEVSTAFIADNATTSVKASTTRLRQTPSSTECDTSGSAKCTSSKPTEDAQRSPKSSNTIAIIVIVVVVIVVVLLGAVGGWFYYACSHSESRSGIWLTQHLPSKISCWKRSPRERYELQTDY